MQGAYSETQPLFGLRGPGEQPVKSILFEPLSLSSFLEQQWVDRSMRREKTHGHRLRQAETSVLSALLNIHTLLEQKPESHKISNMITIVGTPHF